MAEAKLNFNEEELDKESGLYDLYSRFYEGMHEASQVEAPDYYTEPPLDEDGEIDQAAIKTGLDNYSDILMKNSAYMMANAIMSSIGGGGGGGSYGDFVSRAGDTMTGLLGALYGFEAGYGNTKIFDVYQNSSSNDTAHVYGYLIVDKDLSVTESLSLSNSGIYFGANQTLYINDNALNLDYQNMKFTGEIEVDGSMSFGDLVIDEDGILYGDYEFYHSGNSNNENVDWTMKDANVYGNLTVQGTSTFKDTLNALYGFQFGEFGKALLYSVQDDAEEELASIRLASDLTLTSGYAIKFNNSYIIKVREGASNVVSFAAPGMIMNLGDSDGETATQRIDLQTNIYNYAGTTQIVSKNGDGNFTNSLSAGCANSGDTVLQTYYKSTDDCGVVFGHHIRFGVTGGPGLYANSTNNGLMAVMPYVTTTEGGTQQTHQINFGFKYEPTTSLYRDQSKEWSASLNIDTDAEFFTFKKDIEAPGFSIISQTYKTRLAENVLYFADAVYLEGVTGGIRHQGDATFSGSLSSVRFASGFAGYGWAILKDLFSGNIAATFDELTIRKKMRVYELEVQKLSVTNGSLWVSDACSGDLVEEIS